MMASPALRITDMSFTWPTQAAPCLDIAAFELACETHALDEAQARDLADWIEADRTIALAKIA